ncbi:hypothetical protein QE152_g7598 [Popillia japonica]|uniref:Cytochrome P450 n=1 Tax=Popillia japonica TaxID=7064 RepID=A0AAW1M9I1_POPJA
MYPYLVSLGAIFGIWYLVSCIKWLRSVYFPMRRLPGPTRIPIFGTKYRFIGVPRKELFNYGISNLKKYSPIFCTWTASTPELHLVKAEYLEINGRLRHQNYI